MFHSGVEFGACQRGGYLLLIAATLVLTTLPLATSNAAGVRRVSYSGELNYAAFRKAAARNEGVTIRYSPGGTGASAMALARVRNVVIDGVCNSACAWSFVRNGNACFTPRASFGFHAAHDPGTGRRMNAATTYWLQSVRPNLQGRLTPLLRSSSLIRLSADDMRRYYGDRACRPASNPSRRATSARQTR